MTKVVELVWMRLHPSERLCVFVRIRVAGIKGLQGVVRKTVNDELQAIIWEPQHMDKLIPSMLFNMQDSDELDRCGTRSAPLCRAQGAELAENSAVVCLSVTHYF